MKRTTPLQKYAAQFRYEHKNMNDRFSGVKKHANELSKLLDGMFPKDKKEKKRKNDRMEKRPLTHYHQQGNAK